MYRKPSNKEFRKVFDSIASRYDHITNEYVVQRRIKFIKKYAKGECLEIGAGSGKISSVLAKKCILTATDISPKMVEQIKEKNIKALVCDAERLPFKNGVFDTVVAAEVIYYLGEPQKLADEAFRVLKDQGVLIITSANNITVIYDKLRGLLRAIGFKFTYFDDKNRNFMTSKKIRRLLNESGFIIEKEKKAIILPFSVFDGLNNCLEQTPLSYFSSFIFTVGRKKIKCRR